MKLNIVFNLLIIIAFINVLHSIIGYVIAAALVILNLIYSRSIHQQWTVSCVVCLVLIVYSPILALALIAVANIIYYLNINYLQSTQNRITDFIIKRVFVLFITQFSVITLLALIDLKLNIVNNLSFSIVALIIVFSCFWVLLTKKREVLVIK